jgi:hypothetical protein
MSSKPVIPAWQQKQSEDSPESPATPASSLQQDPEPEQQPEQSHTAATDSSSTSGDSTDSIAKDIPLLEQATRFLEDPAIRDAPRERKVAFLESKGVDDKEIETLLGAEIDRSNAPDLEEAGGRAWSTVSDTTSQPPVLTARS